MSSELNSHLMVRINEDTKNRAIEAVKDRYNDQNDLGTRRETKLSELVRRYIEGIANGTEGDMSGEGIAFARVPAQAPSSPPPVAGRPSDEMLAIMAEREGDRDSRKASLLDQLDEDSQTGWGE